MSKGGALNHGPIELVKTPVQVPADFVGIYFGDFPGTSPVPTHLRYKLTCQIDFEGNLGSVPSPTVWREIETTAGVYNWTKLDSWIAAHSARGANIIYCLQGVPAFYSANSTTAGVWPSRLGYGGPLTSPAGTTGLTNFVTALINRYKNTTPIKYLQCWTEPNFNEVQDQLPTIGHGTWWGSQGSLIDLCYTAFTAAKAADPTITVLSPSYFYNNFNTFISVAGTINTGIQGYQTCDWLSTDTFNSGPPALGKGLAAYSGGNLIEIVDQIEVVKRLREDTAAHPLPIAMTSFGFDYAASNVNGSQYKVMQQSPAWRKKWLGRTFLVYAALGMKQALVYSYDSSIRNQYFCGDFINDTNGVVAAFNEINDNVSGKTIVSCTYYQGGQVKAIFSDNSTYII